MPVDNLLIEIGTEELPPKSLNTLRTSLASLFAAGLTNGGFTFTDLKSFATPRRLAVLADNVNDRQATQEVERRGPSVKAAYNEDGSPTKALLGFARSCGILDLKDLARIKTDKGEWVVYRATKAGATLGSELEGIVETALAKLPIDRRMRWGKHRYEFVRPVQWVCALFGPDVIEISVLGLKASRTSHGHRFMSPGTFELAHANDYIEACRQHFVIADFLERQNVVEAQITAKAKSLNANIAIDEALLEEVTALVEWPCALAGKFDEAFLEVPPEVLISAMKEHQRYFHLTSGDDKLLPAFITVANIESTDETAVIAGNERVIRPRLADAVFFYQQDLKSSLESKLDKLAKVVFQSELGSYLAKAHRVASLAAYIAAKISVDEKAASRAGLLCKADLVTEMVGEFTDLQGIMGAYYARNDGESEEVAVAIGQHYRPTQSGGLLPETSVASCVALADKLDTIVGLFSIDQPPTGSRDPFAIRRQALGVIRICIENQLDLNIAECIEKAAELFTAEPLAAERSAVADKPGHHFDIMTVHNYILERLGNWYSEKGISADVVDAVRSGKNGATNLKSTDNLVTTIHAFRAEPVAIQIIAANKRVANLLKKEDVTALPDIDPHKFTDPAEQDLFGMLGKTRQAVAATNDVSVKLESLASMQSTVDTFFDEVLVITDDVELRNNRLKLLAELQTLFLEVADFSRLQ